MAIKGHHPQKTMFILNKPDAPIPKTASWNPLPGYEPIHIVDLRYHQCKWPVTERKGFACGAEVHSGVYCETHRRVAYKEQVIEQTRSRL